MKKQALISEERKHNTAGTGLLNVPRNENEGRSLLYMNQQRGSICLLLLLILTKLDFIYSANWAQASGDIQQNTAIPYYPAPGRPHWGSRYGMVSIVKPAGDLSSFSAVYLFGGDTYSDDFTRRDHTPGVLDSTWEFGYKNDAWKMEGTEWFVKGDIRLRTEYGRKIPRVESRLEWQIVTLGKRPENGMTNDEWIRCEPFFRNLEQLRGKSTSCDSETQVQWSPRRHHAGVYFKNYLWIMGGRAREFVDLPEQRSVGGILDPRIQDIPEANGLQLFSTQREASVYKSDVWRSLDGENWELVTPGCKAPQASLVAEGNPKEGKYGIFEKRCKVDADCYGAEECDKDRKTCVCKIWSPREQHAVAAHGDFMYVTGGYASRLYSQFSNCGPYACGDTDASAYRYYMSDVWRSSDGERWKPITQSAFSVQNDQLFSIPLGRGGHQMIVVQDSITKEPYLWVLGGRGGDNSYEGGPEIYYNDIWTAPITGEPTDWRPLRVNDPRGNNLHEMPWSPRTGHTVVLEQASSENLFIRTVYLYGGYNNGTFFDDVWTWRIDKPGDYWRQDFTSDAYFGTGSGDNFHYANNSPTVHYLKPDSDLSYLKRFWIPTKIDGVTGKREEVRTYITDAEIETMNGVGLETIRDLADIDLYTLLKLRGFDYPQVSKEDRLKMYSICDYRALALAIVDKCSLNLPSLYVGEKNMPWNIKPAFGGPPPFSDNIKWHGRKNYNYLLAEVDDPVVLTDKWDGCTYTPQIQGLFGPNINGIGYVDQVNSVRDPKPELQNLNCRQDPGKRAFHNMVAFEGRIYVMGGKQSMKEFYADTWYRDSKLPQAKISKFPIDSTPDDIFLLSSDKAGSFFEYRVWDPYNYQEIRGWTPVTKKAGVNWLNWRKGGPGSGRYQFYVRAVDPAGNRDERYFLNRNVYIWNYVSPTPWDIIFSVVGAFIGLCILAYFEYRRRVKKAAMERYAMKRMRRKFKAMQRDIDGKAVDWRTLYMESKQAEEADGLKNKKRKLKKQKDKNADKREKERQKREKEKELIKKKLKASKDIKAKKTTKVEPAPDDDNVESQEIVTKTVTKKTIVKKGGTKVSTTEERDEFDDLMDEELGMVTKTTNVVIKEKKKAGGKAATDDGPKEIAAGTLPASKNTEMGFKQRKVNKRFKSYETEEKDDDEFDGGINKKDA